MIKKFRDIVSFGVFNNYKWNNVPRIKDLNDKNIIYGWNYSGKTTLSRIVDSLGKSTIHPDYENVKFEIELYDGTIVSQENINECVLKTIVFNTDYISKNLSWAPTDKWNPIAFDVGENVEIREKINALNLLIIKVKGSEDGLGRTEIHERNLTTFKLFDQIKFVKQAKDIRHIVYNNTLPFDKGHFKRIIVGIIENISVNIITDSDEIQRLTNMSNAKKTLSNILLLESHLEYTKFKKSVKDLLGSSPPKDEIIELLESNYSLYNWVKTGLSFDENKETCSFCNNPITGGRIEHLNNYFSNASKVFRDRITKGKQLIQIEKDRINNIIIPSSKNDFILQCREQVADLLTTYDPIRTKYLEDLDHLINELDRKLDGNVFSPIQLNEIEESESNFIQWFKFLNEQIEEHNKFLSDFDQNQKSARKKLIKHLVAKYLTDENYMVIKEKADKSKKWLDVYKKYTLAKEAEISVLNDQLKNITAGRQKLNDIICKFLNRSDINIEVTDDDKFLLKRGERNAKNLSEGEKTAIAFSYFLIELESKISNKSILENIIYIDDPISSLDNNHISQVYSLINTFFFRKGMDNDNPEKVVNCFRQLFISTHNFEFFSFLKDSGRLKRKKKILQGDTRVEVPSCCYYLINREATLKSSILPMTKSLMRYKSEYIHLFDIIFNFHSSTPDERDKYVILMPNALRRFLEIFTLMKIPSEPDNVESRISELVDDVNEYKTLNHFSHFTTFEKMTRHDELLMNIPKATEELINLIKTDEKHYNSLLKSIKQ